MAFNSTIFIFFFLPISLIFCSVFPKKLRVFLMILFSLIFYAWGEPIFIIFLVASILSDYLFGWLIGDKEDHPGRSGFILFISILINIGVLVYFKYLGFFLDSLNGIGLAGNFDSTMPELALPLGISFIVFSNLSYLIDVYKGETPVQKRIDLLALYISFFPKVLSGPIVRYKDAEPQLTKNFRNLSRVGDGIGMFLIGLAKKVLVADTIGMVWSNYHEMNAAEISVAGSWLAAIAYTLQLYFDFSGYSDMALGISRLFGFEFGKNFDYPLISTSIADFWRRWHITLSAWFRNYIYIPLGGNRVGLFRWIFNTLIVFLLTGLWHGANWTFVVWGVYNGLLIVIERLLFWKAIKKVPVLGHIYAFLAIIIGFSIFSADNLNSAWIQIQNMFNFFSPNLLSQTDLYLLRSYGSILVIALIGATPFAKRAFGSLSSNMKTLFLLIFVPLTLALCTAVIVSSNYQSFIYFQF